MTLQDFIDVLETSELMPINVFQPGLNSGDEKEPLIQFIPSEIKSIKTEISGGTIDKVEINKITKGPATRTDVKVELNIILNSRVIV